MEGAAGGGPQDERLSHAGIRMRSGASDSRSFVAGCATEKCRLGKEASRRPRYAQIPANSFGIRNSATSQSRARPREGARQESGDPGMFGSKLRRSKSK